MVVCAVICEPVSPVSPCFPCSTLFRTKKAANFARCRRTISDQVPELYSFSVEPTRRFTSFGTGEYPIHNSGNLPW
jgi:hypothetical protein